MFRLTQAHSPEGSGGWWTAPGMPKDENSQKLAWWSTDCTFPETVTPSMIKAREALQGMVCGCHLVATLGSAGCAWPGGPQGVEESQPAVGAASPQTAPKASFGDLRTSKSQITCLWVGHAEQGLRARMSNRGLKPPGFWSASLRWPPLPNTHTQAIAGHLPAFLLPTA